MEVEAYMPIRRWLAVLVFVAVTLGLGIAAFHAYRRSQPEHCYACQRVVHAHSRTVAIVDGKARIFCCPACALSEQQQEGKPIRITELTAYLTGGKLSPDDAFLVRGSEVNMCALTHELTVSDKRQAQISYDRCAPSLLAFAQRNEAIEFAREHGGQVLSFAETLAAFSH
jgi:hypothetical protein